jgi:hypothetical protein
MRSDVHMPANAEIKQRLSVWETGSSMLKGTTTLPLLSKMEIYISRDGMSS